MSVDKESPGPEHALSRRPLGSRSKLLLGLSDRGSAADHGRGHVEHRVAVPGLVLESTSKIAAPDVLEYPPEAGCHFLAVDLEGARDAAEDSGGPVLLGGTEEAGLAEPLENRLHLARHVHLHDQRFRWDARLLADLESDHDGRAEKGPEGLLYEEVERRLRARAHFEDSRGRGSERLG